MIIKTLSDESTQIADELKDFPAETGLKNVILMPYGVEEVVINVAPHSGEYYGYQITDIFNFPNFEGCLEATEIIVKEAGLPSGATKCSTANLLKILNNYCGRKHK